MREVFLRPRAQLDLESIYIHIAITLGSPKAARKTIDNLYAAIERAADMPTLGMLFANDALDRDYRRILVKNYWIYYTFDDAQFTVWRIFHTRQDIEAQTLVDL